MMMTRRRNSRRNQVVRERMIKGIVVKRRSENDIVVETKAVVVRTSLTKDIDERSIADEKNVAIVVGATMSLTHGAAGRNTADESSRVSVSAVMATLIEDAVRSIADERNVIAVVVLIAVETVMAASVVAVVTATAEGSHTKSLGDTITVTAVLMRVGTRDVVVKWVLIMKESSPPWKKPRDSLLN
jgi:hypothetical protein